MRIITVAFEAKPGTEAQFKEVIETHARKSLELEPGCRQFDVGQDPVNPARFMVYEVYDDEAAIAAHQAMPHYKETGAKLKDLVASRTLAIYALLPGGKPQR